MAEVTEDPSTWPDWLRESRERAHEALRDARKRRRERERTSSPRGTKFPDPPTRGLTNAMTRPTRFCARRASGGLNDARRTGECRTADGCSSIAAEAERFGRTGYRYPPVWTGDRGQGPMPGVDARGRHTRRTRAREWPEDAVTLVGPLRAAIWHRDGSICTARRVDGRRVRRLK